MHFFMHLELHSLLLAGLKTRDILEQHACQVMVAHREFLRRVLKGCLLSRRVRLLRALIDLKTLAQRFAAVSARVRAEAAPHGGDSSHGDRATGGGPLRMPAKVLQDSLLSKTADVVNTSLNASTSCAFFLCLLCLEHKMCMWGPATHHFMQIFVTRRNSKHARRGPDE